MTSDEKPTIPVCCECGTPADAGQRLAIGTLERGKFHPKTYCLRCWARRYPEIAARQAEEESKKKKRFVFDSGGGKEQIKLV